MPGTSEGDTEKQNVPGTFDRRGQAGESGWNESRMGRIARNNLLYNGCFAHVFSRTMEKRKIFETAEDFLCFKELLLKTKKTYGYQIHHYCIMHTHFHLVVTLGEVSQFSKALQVLKKLYIERYNFKHKRFGPLWRERFKSLLIENESYLFACGRYVEYNPVEAGIVSNSEDWEYSSSRYYSLGEADPLIDDYEPAYVLKNIDCTDRVEFTKGAGIGSALFKMHLRESIYG